MTIHWFRFSDVSDFVRIAEENGVIIDGYHVKLIMMHTPHLCYGLYEGATLQGAALCVDYGHSVMLKHLSIRKSVQGKGFGKRLMHTVLKALEGEERSFYLHAPKHLEGFFSRFGLKTRTGIARYMNVGKVPPFNFTNAHAKELDGSNFENVITKIDYETFKEDRTEFLLDELERNSSLKFTLPNAYQHSSVVNARSVYLGPWQVREGFEEEAEKMMKGLLYFRGLKKVIADVPLCNEHATELYKKYHFEKKADFVHMDSSETNIINFSAIYAFSL